MGATRMDAAGLVILSAVREHSKCGTSPEFQGYGLDAQCRDHDHCAGFAEHCVSCSLKPLYPRHPLVPHSSATPSDTESQFDAWLVKQRIMLRAANRYYASSWVIGS